MENTQGDFMVLRESGSGAANELETDGFSYIFLHAQTTHGTLLEFEL